MKPFDSRRFAVVCRRYDDPAYAQWTDGPTTASRWLAHNIRTIRGLMSAYIVDHQDSAKQYSLVEFRKVFGLSKRRSN